MAQRTTGWTEKKAHQYKIDIKRELDTIEESHGVDGRWVQIQKQIRDLTEGGAEQNDLKVLIYVLSGLVLQGRSRILKPGELRQLIQLGYKISSKHKLDHKTSRLSFIFGEFLMILGQIERAQGDHWQALWCQYTGFKVIRQRPDYSENFQIFTMANRYFRLGHIKRALASYEEVQASLSGANLRQCLVNQARGLRLINNFNAAEEKRREILDTTDESIRNQLIIELDWESMVTTAMQTHDLSAIMTSIRKSKPHYESGYIIEATMWALSSPSKNWLERVPKLKNLSRNKSLTLDRSDQFYRIASFLQQSYEANDAFAARLDELGKLIPTFSQCVNIDKELLCWLAAYRWLIRFKCDDMAHVCLAEYRKICFLISDGDNLDLLNCISIQ